MMFAAAAATAMLMNNLGGAQCSTWTELRHNPPASAVLEAWVIGNIDEFNASELKKPPYLGPEEILNKLDADCAKEDASSIGRELFIEETAFKLSLSLHPPPN